MRKRNLSLIIVLILLGLIGLSNVFQQDQQGKTIEDDLNQNPDNSQQGEKPDPVQNGLPSRENKIPEGQVKLTPEMDVNPPRSHSPEYHDPVPVPGKVNTAGGEDSAFIMPDGKTLYFFFTPDIEQPIEEQVQDQVTGIYVSTKQDDAWSEPTRVLLQDPGKLALDGCAYVQGNIMYFCSAREGYTGLHWFKAEYIEGEWCNWENADEYMKTKEYSTGELHITADGLELYFHSSRPGGKGHYDIWVSQNVDGEWTEPINVEAVNSEGNDGWPFVTQDGSELWFTRDYGVWRSKKVEGEWQEPERMFFPLAGEPSVDNQGNVYFTHHFFKDDVMLDADIYVAHPRKTLKGVSLSPRSSQAEDFLEFLDNAQQVGEVLRWSGDWLELNDTSGGGPEVVTKLAQEYGFIPLIEVSPQTSGRLIRPLNESTRKLYLQSAKDYAAKYHPQYLGIGVEVNSIYLESLPDFDEFVDLYNQVYDAVKRESPETKVYTVFQYEILKGHTLWSTEPVDPDKAQWWIVDLFKTDLVAFTTYPCLVYKDPSQIPDTYYFDIVNYTSKPVAFTEIGWHSEASPLGWESSESEQAEFVIKLSQLTEDLNVELFVWSFLYDPDTIEPFNSMGLIRDDGTNRPAWNSWIEE